MTGYEVPAQEAAVIDQTLRAWTEALEAEDWDAWQTYWTDDAVLMPPQHARVEGRDQILETIRGAGRYHEIVFEDVEIEGRGDLAVVTSSVHWTMDRPDGTTEEHVKQIVVMHRQREGWRVASVLLNQG